MPKRNAVKIYYENAFYHVYNRGVEKREIFIDRSDYVFFLHLLKTALLPPIKGDTLQKARFIRPRKNFYQDINLLCYCLMPNHYHLLINQHNSYSLAKFIQSISTAYAMYFNKKYSRVGRLFEGVFKAVDINDENYLFWLTRYIHRNPTNFRNYEYSSYNDYLGTRQTKWINTQIILDFFSSTRAKKHANYKQFVDDETIEEPMDLGSITME